MAEIDVDKLINSYNQITDRILEITLTPKPDYNIDGQQVKWADYLRQLNAAQKALKDQIDSNVDPWEIDNEVIC